MYSETWLLHSGVHTDTDCVKVIDTATAVSQCEIVTLKSMSDMDYS